MKTTSHCLPLELASLDFSCGIYQIYQYDISFSEVLTPFYINKYFGQRSVYRDKGALGRFVIERVMTDKRNIRIRETIRTIRW